MGDPQKPAAESRAGAQAHSALTLVPPEKVLGWRGEEEERKRKRRKEGGGEREREREEKEGERRGRERMLENFSNKKLLSLI